MCVPRPDHIRVVFLSGGATCASESPFGAAWLCKRGVVVVLGGGYQSDAAASRITAENQQLIHQHL